jgi:hypothetical protein
MNSHPHPLTVYQASSVHLYSEIGSEAVILDLESGTYYGLNETGNQIWQWLQKPKTFSELSKLILDEYDVPIEEALGDLQSLLQEMVSKGLIEIVNEEANRVSALK